MKYLIKVFFLLILPYQVWCQSPRTVVQFSGLVVGGDSLYGIPGVALYVTRAGRGTNTSETGYFTMPTLVGDTVVISALGYKKKEVIVPKSESQSVTLIVELVEDTIYLPIVEIFPYPTEELFKQAFLAMGTGSEWNTRMANNLDPQVMMRMLNNSSMSKSDQQRYSLRSQLYPGAGSAYSQGFQLFNPYAWSDMIRTVRKNKRKSKYENADY